MHLSFCIFAFASLWGQLFLCRDSTAVSPQQYVRVILLNQRRARGDPGSHVRTLQLPAAPENTEAGVEGCSAATRPLTLGWPSAATGREETSQLDHWLLSDGKVARSLDNFKNHLIYKV